MLSIKNIALLPFVRMAVSDLSKMVSSGWFRLLTINRPLDGPGGNWQWDSVGAVSAAVARCRTLECTGGLLCTSAGGGHPFEGEQYLETL